MVPDTPLVTSKVLSEETDHWLEVKQGLALALQEMRVNQVRTNLVLVNIFYSMENNFFPHGGRGRGV